MKYIQRYEAAWARLVQACAAARVSPDDAKVEIARRSKKRRATADTNDPVALTNELRDEIAAGSWPNSKVSYHADNAGGAHGKATNDK
jgi:hypothetical protein